MPPRLLAALLCLGFAVATPAGQARPDIQPVAGDEILIEFRAHADDSRRDAAIERIGGRKLKRFKQLRVDHVRLARGRRADETIAELLQRDDVVAAQPNYSQRATFPSPPNDPFWTQNNTHLWGVERIQSDDVWAAYTTGDPDIVVAAIDSGVQYDHPDLAPNIWINPGEIAGNGVDDDANGYVDDVHGIDTFNHDSDPMDDNGHGTHTAGTIGARGNNGVGAVGVNWNATILPCKILDANGNGSDASAIECFDYITLMKSRGVNIRVSNNSWGRSRDLNAPFPQVLKNAIDAAGDAGIINIFAAGNDGVNIDTFPHDPASFTSPSIVSVAASTRVPLDGRANFSNFGSTSVDLVAPGAGIVSTYFNAPGCSPPCYAISDGTSMAAPHVSGAAALLLAQYGDLSVPGIRQLLLQNVTRVSAWAGRVATGGRLNAFTAANALNANTPPGINITSPAAGSIYDAPASIAITADASDTGSITSVEFFLGATSVGIDTAAPYSVTVNNVTAGGYAITARATDNLGVWTVSAPVEVFVGLTDELITDTLIASGTRLQQLQNADGGWFFRAGDGDCGTNAFAGGSCNNIIGVTALGLLSAYNRGGPTSLLDDALQAGLLLQAIRAANPTLPPFSQDLEFLRALSVASNDPQWASLAAGWFATITKLHPIADDRVQFAFNRRGTNFAVAVWDLASTIRSAKAAGRADYAQALGNAIVAREEEWRSTNTFTTLAMGSLLWAMHDLPGFDAPIGDYRSYLLGLQGFDGSWSGGSLQDTAYVALGLGAVGGTGVEDAIEDAVAFFINHQLANGGFPFSFSGGVAGSEFATVDSEVTRAIGILYNTGTGSSVSVAPAQLASVTFSDVIAAGTTSVVATSSPSEARVSNAYLLLNLNYEVVTTADFSGAMTVCVSVPWDAVAGRFDDVRLLHARGKTKNDKLEDVTILKGALAPDASTKRVCGELSPKSSRIFSPTVSVALKR